MSFSSLVIGCQSHFDHVGHGFIRQAVQPAAISSLLGVSVHIHRWTNSLDCGRYVAMAYAFEYNSHGGHSSYLVQFQPLPAELRKSAHLRGRKCSQWNRLCFVSPLSENKAQNSELFLWHHGSRSNRKVIDCLCIQQYLSDTGQE